jgi:hypothetical protein
MSSQYITGVDENVVSDLYQGGSFPTAKGTLEGTVEVAEAPYGHFFVTQLEGQRFLLALPPEAAATRVEELGSTTEWKMAVERDESTGVILHIVAIEKSSGSKEFVGVISRPQRSRD